MRTALGAWPQSPDPHQHPRVAPVATYAHRQSYVLGHEIQLEKLYI